ncbi:cytochrome-c oxidase subunit 3 protein [Rhizobium etli 8C-3]|uniref:Cytochrome-c oxidase subunit 3 protein n=1 Tax=Rhizobium etli 8C-3 TaxID=538025 RepID=A0A1L5P7R5_RHIET|nr:cytochrome c oxidase subunit 3 [Rhizobium etli]APO76143.1 cytochrome-c oxidase subunit 3 protein [Rhizobium etli 8C-3]
MSVILIFLAVIAVIAFWWMTQHRLTSKPWLEVGLVTEPAGEKRLPMAPARVGLGIFLAVVGALFALLISAYFMRMAAADWWATPIPRLLWVNTAALALSSAALEWAKVEARSGRNDIMRVALLSGLATAFLFLAGQVMAWRELAAAGYVLADNPANSFFYIMTGLHGLHILGGLAVLGRTTGRAFDGRFSAAKLQLSLELCAVYWHFMLFVWIVLFALLAGWANDFVDLCRQLIS